ncbi:phosphoglycerate mutase-like protein [Ganoderma leucocontextum]|nr:phosphoglycerate mutase-like protein [Ganoderma leucocontextum]
MAVVAKVYIVRHGETDANREGVIQGHLDTALNPAGILQAKLVADALEDVPLGAAYSSDLQRARKTAEIILENHPKLELEASEALRERFMGEWQGEAIAKRANPPPDLEPLIDFHARGVKWWNKTVARLAQRKASELRTRRDGCATVTKAESDGDAGKANGHASLMELEGEEEEMAELGFEPIHILAVSHGGFIGSLVTNLLGSRKVLAAEGVSTGWCYNASISVIDIEENEIGLLISYADTTHLDGDVLHCNVDVQLN